MLKLFKENYDNALSFHQKKLMGSRNRPLTSEEEEACLKRAKEAVCEIGVSMYQFRKFLNTRYKKTVENEAIHQAVEKGIAQEWLQWGSPRRFDSDRGEELRNIILTEKGFEIIRTPGVQLAISFIHTSYVDRPRRRIL
jgi:hypothetical protein